MATGQERGGGRVGLLLFAAAVLSVPLGGFAAQAPAQDATAGPAAIDIAPPSPDGEIVRFLIDGKVSSPKTTKKGVTGAQRATLPTPTRTHDAQIQTIDEYKREFGTDRGVEFDFRDSWPFNVAA